MDRGLSRVLFVDLSAHRAHVEERPELFRARLGGTGVAIELLHELCPEGADPLSPENPVILAVGPLSALFPLASKTVALFKSPHTGNLGESHCGGRSAVALRLAGYGAVVITGRSDIPVYIVIEGGKVHFRDARALWGLSSSFTVGRIIWERESGSGFRSILRIGVAGENLVTYANVVAESYRHFGRLGLGAVFGAKRLKAVVIIGKGRVPVADGPRYSRLYRELHGRAVRSELFKKYHDLGTPQNVRPLNAIGALPVRNLRENRYPDEPPFTGERMAERYLGRRLACAGCPVACIHLAALREPYPDEPFFYKTTFVSYDYEPIYSLGTMLGGQDPEGFLKLMEAVEHLGLDAMSCGVVLAWATEATERGLISGADTGGLVPRWGDYGVYIQMARRTSRWPGGSPRGRGSSTTSSPGASPRPRRATAARSSPWRSGGTRWPATTPAPGPTSPTSWGHATPTSTRPATPWTKRTCGRGGSGPRGSSPGPSSPRRPGARSSPRSSSASSPGDSTTSGPPPGASPS